MFNRNKAVSMLAFLVMVGFVTTFANAAILSFEDFEDSPVVVGAPTDWQDDGNDNARTDVSGSDGIGGDAAKGARVRSSTGEMFLRIPLALASGGYDTLTITFDVKPHTSDYNSRLEYSALGNFTDSVLIVDVVGGTAPYNPLDTWVLGDSHTITDGVGGIVFTDTANLRVYSDGGGSNPTYNVFDDIEIKAEVAVPEPTSLALLSMGSLAMLVRRRD